MRKKKLLPFLGLLGIYAIVLTGCIDDDNYDTQGVWRRCSDFDGLARAQAASFVIGNEGYLCGGYTGKEHLNDLWKYNIEKNYWTQCADMPEEASPRKDAVGFSIDNKGYITTGGSDITPYYYKDTWEYNPESDSWTQKDDFRGSARKDALAFTLGNYGYVGMGYDGNYQKDIYRFNPNAPQGSQWEMVNGYGGSKRQGGSAFVIDNVAYICLGENNGTTVPDFWKFDGTNWTQLRDIIDSDEELDYDDDYNIVRSHAVAFVIDGKGYVTLGTNAGTLCSDYWVYHPEEDLWYGDIDDAYTPFTGATRQDAVVFSTGERSIIATGRSSSYYYDDTWELLPYEIEYN